MKEDEVMITVSNLKQKSQALLLWFFTAAKQLEMLSYAIAFSVDSYPEKSEEYFCGFIFMYFSCMKIKQFPFS